MHLNFSFNFSFDRRNGKKKEKKKTTNNFIDERTLKIFGKLGLNGAILSEGENEIK